MENGLENTARLDEASLSRLELICLTLAANGLHVSDISQRLQLSESEVETLLFVAEGKLGARNRLHAIAMAVQQGLIGIEV
jgi:DNA-binding CsgD family transcriptional regulator